MLVLLIIFMVTASYITRGAFDVNLPSAANSSDVGDSPIQISISAGGELSFNGQRSDIAGISQAVAPIIRDNPDVQAVVDGDRGVGYGRVMELIDALKTAGVRNFAAAVERVPAPASPDSGDSRASRRQPQNHRKNVGRNPPVHCCSPRSFRRAVCLGLERTVKTGRDKVALKIVEKASRAELEKAPLVNAARPTPARETVTAGDASSRRCSRFRTRQGFESSTTSRSIGEQVSERAPGTPGKPDASHHGLRRPRPVATRSCRCTGRWSAGSPARPRSRRRGPTGGRPDGAPDTSIN